MIAEPLLLHRYQPLRLLGSGAFATTHLALDTYTSTHVAIKRLAQEHTPIARHEHEVLLRLRRRNSRHFVRLLSSFRDEQSPDVLESCLVLELLDSSNRVALPDCAHGGLGHDLFSCPERVHTLADLAVQLLAGMHELHTLGFIHADLKPDNIMYVSSLSGTRAKVKIIDLGNAAAKLDTHLYHDDFEIQSLGYRAPEVLLGDRGFDERIDIWSVGVILLELLAGEQLTGGRIIKGNTREEVVAVMMRWFGDLDCYKSTGLLWDDAFPSVSATATAIKIPKTPSPQKSFRTTSDTGSARQTVTNSSERRRRSSNMLRDYVKRRRKPRDENLSSNTATSFASSNEEQIISFARRNGSSTRRRKKMENAKVFDFSTLDTESITPPPKLESEPNKMFADDAFEAAIISRTSLSSAPPVVKVEDNQTPPPPPPPPPPSQSTKLDVLLKDPRRQDLLQFMKRLLNVDFRQRPTAVELLRDPFLVDEVLGVWGSVLMSR